MVDIGYLICFHKMMEPKDLFKNTDHFDKNLSDWGPDSPEHLYTFKEELINAIKVRLVRERRQAAAPAAKKQRIE